ncbi:MAG: DUF1800 family protein, partial [Gammaproteobacteria bacterium]|nr:DUF1800 family protein [Gammaproteobacteria bacterium]
MPKKHYTPSLLALKIIIFIFIFFITSFSVAIAASSESQETNIKPLTIILKNSISGNPVSGVEITARERLSGGGEKWIGKKVTDKNGTAVFELDSLGAGRTYFFKAKPYINGTRVISETIHKPGTFNWKVGTVEVAVRDATQSNSPALINTSVIVSEVNADETLTWFQMVTSDAKGILRLDLPGMDKGRRYILRAKSTLDEKWKKGQPISTSGTYTFNVGTKPLTVTLKNAISDNPVSGVEITAKEKLSDGSEKWAGEKVTDKNGTAVFELDGLGAGRTYFFTAKPYINISGIISKTFYKPGTFNWKVGTVKVTVRDATQSNYPTIANTQVIVYEVASDGSLTWFQSVSSDAEGILRLDLPEMDKGRQYVLRAKSTLSGKWKRSQLISKLGSYTFKVGTKPLTITLKNFLSGIPVSGVEIFALENLTDGSKKWVGKKVTDENGIAVFELDDLGAGRTYFFKARPYSGSTRVVSKTFHKPGTFNWKVGTVEVTVHNATQSNSPILANTQVIVSKVANDGALIWFQSVTSDAGGILRLDLPEMDKGRQYVLRAKSTLSGKWKRSQAIITSGTYIFNVGTKALNVSLHNGISETAVSEVKIVAMERLADGSEKWHSENTTDAKGQAVFELDGLGEGRKYYLKAVNPYGTGNVNTSILTSTGDFKFPIGTILVTLLDGDNGIPLSEKKLVAFRITPEQKRIWVKSGITSQEGRVYFDLDGLDNGETYVFSAIKPFNKDRFYHSKVIRSEGPVTLEITRDGSSSLDLQPPTIFILSPAPSGFANASGFLLQGLADDNDKLSYINVAITDSIAGITTVPATYDILTKRWEAPINISAITPGEMITVSVTAVDNTNNERTVSAEYIVTTDSSPPIVELISPKNGASVAAGGFIVKGTAVDNVGIVELYVSLSDPLLGTTVDRQHINLTLGDANWMFTIYNDQVSPGEMVSLSLEAADAAGNKSLTAVTFKTDSRDVRIPSHTSASSHILNRITFGATPELLKRVERIGPQEYISQQLNPHTIDDSVLRTRMKKFKPKDANELQWYLIQYMLDSEHQLNEVMTWFWDNHFNTHLGKHGKIQYELEENNQFRQQALGRFRDLLEISAKSPAMLYYLDSVRNIKAEPNENYARELMELHTLGVDGGYDHHDIESLAKIFTGWRVKDDQFYFDARRHNDQDKNFLGNTITAGGVEEGEAVLDILATHPSTAFFICTKLGQYFISDTPEKSFTENCADIFLASDGDIKQILSYILSSSEFLSPINMRIKIKTPIEFITGVVRGLDATPNEQVIRWSLNRMGVRLFRNPVPTGWPEIGDNWINPN